MAKDIHVGDVGTLFRVTLTQDDGSIFDVSSATVKTLIFARPDGSTMDKLAVFITNGSDGKIGYITIANDLNVAGSWKLQAYVELPTGKWHSAIAKFKVKVNLE